MNRTEWALSFFMVVDSQKIEDITAYMTNDVRLRMGNFEAAIGVEYARQAFADSAERFMSIQHVVDGVWEGMSAGQEVVSVECRVRYTLKGGREIEIPATSTLRLRGEKICDYRIFIDPTPLWA